MSTRSRVTPLMVSVHYENDNPLFGDSATHIRVDDEAAGGFFVLQQNADGLEPGQVKFDADELEIVAREGKRLMQAYDEACQRAEKAQDGG